MSVLRVLVLVGTSTLAQAASDPFGPQMPGQDDAFGDGYSTTRNYSLPNTGGTNDRFVSVDIGQSVFVDPTAGNFSSPGPCRYITNVSAPKPIVVPISNSTEWQDFYSGTTSGGPPPGVTAVVCCRPQSTGLCSSATSGATTRSTSYVTVGTNQSLTAQCADQWGQTYSDTKTFSCADTGSGAATDGVLTMTQEIDVPPPPQCPATTANWGNCHGSLAQTPSGSSTSASNIVSGYTGSATYSCSSGTWTIGANSCTASSANVTVTYSASDNIGHNVYNDAKNPAYASPVWNGTSAVTLTIVVNAGVVLGAPSTANYALIVPSGWPVGTTAALTNNGWIVGAGGLGGTESATCYIYGYSAGLGCPGGNGGNALYITTPLKITNNGIIAGGGGGGGGGADNCVGLGCWGGTGGPGAGSIPGPPNGSYAATLTNGGASDTGDGAANSNPGGAIGQSGTPGTYCYTQESDAGGGGGLGGYGGYGMGLWPCSPGDAPGGAPGYYIVGIANVTWLATGQRYGLVQ